MRTEGGGAKDTAYRAPHNATPIFRPQTGEFKRVFPSPGLNWLIQISQDQISQALGSRNHESAVLGHSQDKVSYSEV